MEAAIFLKLTAIILFSSLTLLAGMYLLARFNGLFKVIRNEFLRKNFVVWLIALCLMFSVSPTTHDFDNAIAKHKLLQYYFAFCLVITLEVLVVFNISWAAIKYLERKKISFRTRMIIILFTIIASSMLVGVPVNFLGNIFEGSKNSFNNIQFTLLFNFYLGCMAGLIYITMSYVDLDRQKKLNEKELEVSRLRELKTKAELDALHSKINPHFLYNALNSIADLSITDGKKARKMTVALADLFRYSINYNNHNYSTIKEELEMTEVYLQIEKIRFEDKLNYSISSPHEVSHYLVPRFMLQPIVENAVKHGLKATGKMTEIDIEVKDGNGNLEILVGDNGPAFPEELIPGYGVKSIYDKLDLLFPNEYEIHFANQPTKRVSIHIHKLIKNEPTV
jgi:two-component system, LytTR family, sensor kinase